jgi:4-hydroxybenzoate polyprenyltransferase
LVLSSVALYLGGLVSNDLFDTKVDKIERPNRPLPSGMVQKKYAIILLIVFLSAGFSISLLFNYVTVGISGLLIISILIYNYKLKNGILRPFLMGGIRALNIVYGFTILFGFHSFTFDISVLYLNLGTSIETRSLELFCLVLASVFFHIFVLTFVSSKETTREYTSRGKKRINIKTILYIYTTFLFIIGTLGFYLVKYPTVYILIVLVIGIVVLLIFYKAHLRMFQLEASKVMQFIVKNMIILLIMLDSAFIAGISGPIIGLATASLILPSILLSKKISMT